MGTSWRFRRIGDFLREGEFVTDSLAVRFPVNGIPYYFLLTGCGLVLTNMRLLVLDYGKVTGVASRVIWDRPRERCSATMQGGKIRLAASDGAFMDGKEMLVSPLRLAEARDFVRHLESNL